MIHFVHGKESGPWGSKITYLAKIARDLGYDVESLDYSGIDDPHDRVQKLVAAASDQSRPLILVGSSMGGWVATAASQQLIVEGLFLLAPAFYLPGYPDVTPKCDSDRIEVVHGFDDDVILYEHSLRFGRRFSTTLHLINDDHRLGNRLDLIGEYFANFLSRLNRQGIPG